MKTTTTTANKIIKLHGNFTLPELMSLISENAAEYFKRECVISNAADVKNFLKQALSYEEREHFAVMFLDKKHALIKFEIMFSGTIDSSSVYPREVVKRALELNAAAVVLSHNHPSGITEPSQSDKNITQKLKSALDTVGIRILDHIIVGSDCTSFAERGLI
jgi:DNA repair protein RadC